MVVDQTDQRRLVIALLVLIALGTAAMLIYPSTATAQTNQNKTVDSDTVAYVTDNNGQIWAVNPTDGERVEFHKVKDANGITGLEIGSNDSSLDISVNPVRGISTATRDDRYNFSVAQGTPTVKANAERSRLFVGDATGSEVSAYDFDGNQIWNTSVQQAVRIELHRGLVICWIRRLPRRVAHTIAPVRRCL